MIKHSITPETLSVQVSILNLLNYYFNVSKFKKVFVPTMSLFFAKKLVAATKALLFASVILPSSRSDERAVKA